MKLHTATSGEKVLLQCLRIAYALCRSTVHSSSSILSPHCADGTEVAKLTNPGVRIQTPTSTYLFFPDTTLRLSPPSQFPKIKHDGRRGANADPSWRPGSWVQAGSAPHVCGFMQGASHQRQDLETPGLSSLCTRTSVHVAELAFISQVPAYCMLAATM